MYGVDGAPEVGGKIKGTTRKAVAACHCFDAGRR